MRIKNIVTVQIDSQHGFKVHADSNVVFRTTLLQYSYGHLLIRHLKSQISVGGADLKSGTLMVCENSLMTSRIIPVRLR